MAIIDPKYSIGIDAMDAQHAHWIRLIEEFKAAGSGHLLQPDGVKAAKIALDKLFEYTQSHFVSEEKLIAEHGYPGLEDHKRKHRELVAEVTKLQEEIRSHEHDSAPLKLNLFVTIWLLEHIMSEDILYARFILSKT